MLLETSSTQTVHGIGHIIKSSGIGACVHPSVPKYTYHHTGHDKKVIPWEKFCISGIVVVKGEKSATIPEILNFS